MIHILFPIQLLNTYVTSVSSIPPLSPIMPILSVYSIYCTPGLAGEFSIITILLTAVSSLPVPDLSMSMGASMISSDGGLLLPVSLFGDIWPEFGWLSAAVERATGWGGLIIIFIYSFLIAFALPGVSEIVLLAPIDLGLSQTGRLGIIMLVSGAGKAAGSVFAFHLGQEVKQSGPVLQLFQNSWFDLISWSERRTVALAQQWGYAGLAAALSVPGFPDTISIYAFSVLEEDYLKFALATFIGSIGRLIVTVIGVGAVSAFI